jgi:hypothetical protein
MLMAFPGIRDAHAAPQNFAFKGPTIAFAFSLTAPRFGEWLLAARRKLDITKHLIPDR